MKFQNKELACAIINKTLSSNMNGKEAAMDIDISAPAFSRIIKGKIPDLLTYAKCCKWLRVSLNSFFTTD